MRETIAISIAILVVAGASWFGLNMFKDSSLIRGLKSDSSDKMSHSSYAQRSKSNNVSISVENTRSTGSGALSTGNRQQSDQTRAANNSSASSSRQTEAQRRANSQSVRHQAPTGTETVSSNQQVRASNADDSERADDTRLYLNRNGSMKVTRVPRETVRENTASQPKLLALGTVKRNTLASQDSLTQQEELSIDPPTQTGLDDFHRIAVRLLPGENCANSPSGEYETEARFLSGKAAMTSESIQSLERLIKTYRTCAQSLIIMSHDIKPDADISTSVFIRREDEVKYFLLHMRVDRDDIELLERS